MKIITITNQKGGVGKTTTSHILCTGLIKEGYKVLAIDSDPQMNLSYTTGIMEADSDLYDVFKGKISSSQAISKTNVNYDIIAGSLNLAGADMEFTQAGREYILKEALEPIKENYDFIIIDTPPTLGILTVNSLTASDSIIIPMGADIFSLQGLSQLQGLIKNVQKYCNPDLQIDGLLLTKYNQRAVINKQLKSSLEEIAEKLGTKLYKSCIREAIAIKEIQLSQGNIFADYPNANVTKDYQAFINEFLSKGDEET